MAWIPKEPRTLKNGEERWTAQIYAGRNSTTGNVQFISKTFKRRTDAEKWARKMETRKDAGDRPTTDKRTL